MQSNLIEALFNKLSTNFKHMKKLFSKLALNNSIRLSTIYTCLRNCNWQFLLSTRHYGMQQEHELNDSEKQRQIRK